MGDVYGQGSGVRACWAGWLGVLVRVADQSVVNVLQGAVNHRWEAAVLYDGQTVIPKVPVTNVSFKEDASAGIEMSGSCEVVWSSEFGESISPRGVGDPLSPFGSELQLFSVITVGPAQESRVAMGVFPITSVPSAMDEDMVFRGQWITVGSTVRVEFKDHMAKVDRDRFDVPTAPVNLTSVWGEVSRIADMSIVQGVPDAAITRAVMYQENRLDAVRDLLELLDAVPHMTSFGALSARPNVWPAPVARLRRADSETARTGQVVSVGRSMGTSKVYNRVAFRGKADNQQKILASAEITAGPLRTRNADGSKSPFGRVTKFLASDLVSTPQQAQEWVDRELLRVAQLGTVELPVVEMFNPLRERGDVIEIERPRDEILTGRVVEISRGSGATQELKVEVLSG